MHAFKMFQGGVIHHGAWLLHADGTVEVRSDYGRLRMPTAGRDPSTVARTVLAAIIESRRPDAEAAPRRRA